MIAYVRRAARLRAPPRGGERGAALIAAVLLAAALSIVAGAVTWFAVLATQTSAAARDRADVDDAIDAGIAATGAALASEPDLAAVRRGDAVAPRAGVSALATVDGVVDVAGLGQALERRRRRRPAPDDAAVWRPYLWGRLGELVTTPIGTTARDPLVVAWVRGDDAAALGPDRIEIAVEAVGASGARAAAVAVLRIGPRGAATLAIWRETAVNGPG